MEVSKVVVRDSMGGYHTFLAQDNAITYRITRFFGWVSVWVSNRKVGTFYMPIAVTVSDKEPR